MLNSVSLVGDLADDSQVRTFDDGGMIVTMRVRTWSEYVDRNSGEVRHRDDWHNVAAYGAAARSTPQLAKGTLVAVQGRLQTRKYEKDGETRYATEVVADRISEYAEHAPRGEERRQGRQQRESGGGYGSQSRGGQQRREQAPRQAQAFEDDNIPF